MSHTNSQNPVDDFSLRSYGRTELAMLYFPQVTPQMAWRKLKYSIRLFPGLLDRLHSLGYVSTSRTFTPIQVRAIVESIGEP